MNTKSMGVIFLILSFVLYVSVIVIPMLSMTNTVKVFMIGALVILSEVFFWLGTLLLGKNILKTLYQKIFRKNKSDS
jgi:hypothetical protein